MAYSFLRFTFWFTQPMSNTRVRMHMSLDAQKLRHIGVLRCTSYKVQIHTIVTLANSNYYESLTSIILVMTTILGGHYFQN